MSHKCLRMLSIALVLVLLLGIVPTATAAYKSPLKFDQPSYAVTAGFTVTVGLVDPVGSDYPEDIKFSIKKAQQKYATVDAETGVVTARKAGTIYVYASSKSLGSKATVKAKLKISANSVSWQWRNDKSVRFYCNVKRIYYTQGQLVGELFLYNNHFKKGLTKIADRYGRDMMLSITDVDENVVATANLGITYKFKSKVAKGRSTIIKAVFEPKSDAIFNLRSGDYDINWDGYSDNDVFFWEAGDPVPSGNGTK